MPIRTPYLLFLGDAPHAKTAQGVLDWQPELCLAQSRYPSCRLDLGLPEMGFAEAAAAGARSVLIGSAPAGGRMPPAWITDMRRALEAGLDIASGLHERLNDHPDLKPLADRLGRTLWDVRRPNREFSIGAFERRSGKRLLTVGADCAVGKKYTALAIEREMRARGMDAGFRATGQTGILIAGDGIAIDAVVADFIAAAAAELSPAADANHWDVIEGQGSLFHPAYAGVTLGLVHGSQPDAMVLCADPTRPRLGAGDFDLYPQPDLGDCVRRYTEAARLTNAEARVIAVSLNTSKLDESAARTLLNETEARLGLPCVDPIRTGVGPVVDLLAQI
ncbi:MAG: DUF1611 domain-containing protein [Sphingomonadales bacterium]|nr:DUF1611 domain-containing protein [Sphingomonadales bacterium]